MSDQHAHHPMSRQYFFCLAFDGCETDTVLRFECLIFTFTPYRNAAGVEWRNRRYDLT